MDKKDAIAFLKENQPLPDDGEKLEAIISIFDDVRKYFFDNPDPECIPLFLNCFGQGSGYGVYQLIEDVLSKYNESDVVPHLKNALQSKHPSVRYWCSQIAEQFESEDLIEELINVYEKGDIDAKCASLTALSGIEDEKVISLAKKTLEDETDEVLCEIAEDIVNG